MEAPVYTFVKIIDYMILNSDDDIKMKNAIYYLDIQAKRKGMTIYQIIYDLLKKNILKERMIPWSKAP